MDTNTDSNRGNSVLGKILESAYKIELALGGLSLAILFCVVIYGIIARLLGIQATWYEETTRVFFLWMMWLGVGGGFYHCESSRVTIFVNHMPKAIQKFCHALYYVVNIIMFVILIYFGTRLAIQQYTMGEMGSALRIPMWLVGICVPIGSFFGLLGVLNTLFFEQWRLKTTADELEMEAIAAETKAKLAAEEKREGEKQS